MVWRPLAFAAVCLLAGCLSDDAPVTAPPAAEEPGLEPAAAVPTTWFLHKQPTGPANSNGQPTCQAQDAYLDLNDSAGDCEDGERARPVGSLVFESACSNLCFAARQGAPASYPAGTSVRLLLYVTTDAADRMDFTARLAADGKEVASGEARQVLVTTPVSLTYQEVALDLQLAAAIAPGAILELDVHVTAMEAYFLGFEGERASRLTFAR